MLGILCQELENILLAKLQVYILVFQDTALIVRNNPCFISIR